jgi:hypothetical protein
MAKQSSIIKIEGTIDDLTFLKTEDGYIVRKKSGISASRIANDPAFERTRENGKEFGHTAQMGKLLRKAVIDLSAGQTDSKIVSRVQKQLGLIKNLDSTSDRGERKVWIGMETPEGKEILKGFNFNSNAPLSAVLLKGIDLDVATGGMSLVDFDPSKHLTVPQGATRVSFRSGWLNINFETGQTALTVSPEVVTSVHAPPADLELIPEAVPEGDGNQMFLLWVAFHQELNGKRYPIKSGAYNALSIVEVL